LFLWRTELRTAPKIFYVAQAIVAIACFASLVICLLNTGCKPTPTPSSQPPAITPPPARPDPAPVPAAAPASYTEAVSRSAATGKPLALMFTASWCGPCKKMHSGTLQDSRVRERLKGFVWWEVDADKHPELLRQWVVHSLPSYRLAHGEIEYRRAIGYMPPAKFVEWLGDP
jgi:thiol:disulfide interchange protein